MGTNGKTTRKVFKCDGKTKQRNEREERRKRVKINTVNEKRKGKERRQQGSGFQLVHKASQTKKSKKMKGRCEGEMRNGAVNKEDKRKKAEKKKKRIGAQ